MLKGRVRRRVRRAKVKVRRTPSASAVAAKSDAKDRLAAGGLVIGGAQDPAEKEADATADRVMQMTPAPSVVQRECACEENKEGENRAQRAEAEPEEAEKVERRAASPMIAPRASAAPAPGKAAKAISNLGTPQRMSRSERAFFEPRFGTDLSGVRIHDGPQADRAAQSVHARAFTLGSDIVFARNQRQQGNPGADRLLAHELAHVTHESNALSRQAVRRATLATADLAVDNKYKKVPAKHYKRVNAALSLIQKQIKAKKCAAYFKDKCSGGAADELSKAFKDSTVYYLKEKGDTFGKSKTRNVVGDDRSVAYNTTAYQIGRWEVAATLLHEMFHTCILGSIANEEQVAETSVETCEFYTPWTLTLSQGSGRVGDTIEMTGFQYGPQHDADHKVALAGVDITPDSWAFEAGNSSVKIVFKVPAGAKSGDLVVTNHGIKSNPKKFKVLP